MSPALQVAPASAEELTALEPLIDRLGEPAAALDTLTRLGDCEADALRPAGDAEDGPGENWAARVEIAGTTVFVVAQGGRWAIHAPAGADEADAMLAARRLHGLIGQQNADWDLDR